MDAYRVLGIAHGATETEIRQAYHRLAKACHPDLQDNEEEQLKAQEKMVQLNLAYKEALQQAGQHDRYIVMPPEKAWAHAKEYFQTRQWEKALVQLSHIQERGAAWYRMQGDILMQMRQWGSALQAYKICVQMEPDNQEYHQAALDAAVAVRRHSTLPYRILDWARDLLGMT